MQQTNNDKYCVTDWCIRRYNKMPTITLATETHPYSIYQWANEDIINNTNSFMSDFSVNVDIRTYTER